MNTTRDRKIANLRRRIRRLQKCDGRWSWARQERRLLAMGRAIADAKRLMGCGR